LQIQAFVKNRFGTELNTNLISSYKKTLAGKRGKKKKGAGTKAHGQPRQQAVAEEESHTRTPAAALAGISLEDVRAVKDLVGRVGPDHFRTLIDLFA